MTTPAVSYTLIEQAYLDQIVASLKASVHENFESYMGGTLVAGTIGQMPWSPFVPSTMGLMVITVGTSPVGGTGIRVDWNKNHASIFPTTGAQPNIAPGQTRAFALPAAANNPSFLPTDILTTDVDTVGSGTPGSNLMVQCYLIPA